MKLLWTLVVGVLLLAALQPFRLTTPIPPALAAPAFAPTKPVALSVHVSPAQININRDVSLSIRVTDPHGKLVQGALLSLTGAGRPDLGTATHGTLTLKVHATALGTATLVASHA